MANQRRLRNREAAAFGIYFLRVTWQRRIEIKRYKIWCHRYRMPTYLVTYELISKRSIGRQVAGRVREAQTITGVNWQCPRRRRPGRSIALC